MYHGDMKKTFNIVDLFSGCGGFSLGAHLAGYKSLLAVDIDPILSSSFKYNFPDTPLLNADLGMLPSENLLNAIGDQKIHGVIGGPPCQGFSMMGKRDKNDPRNTLITHFFRHVIALDPDFFIMENVPGLLTSAMKPLLDEAIEAISEKYTVIKPFVVNAHDYGAATIRKRMVLIGYKPSTYRDMTAITFMGNAIKANVRDAIADLPPPTLDTGFADFEWSKYNEVQPSEYAKKARSLPPKGLGSEIARQKLAEGFASGFQNTVHSEVLVRRYGKLESGKSDPISKSKKLDWTKPSNTLRAGTGREKGAFQAVRPIHPREPRVITVREAARLQGFPDWFMFHPAKWHSFRMIGNSVSPYMSEAILKILAENAIQNEVHSTQLQCPHLLVGQQLAYAVQQS